MSSIERIEEFVKRGVWAQKMVDRVIKPNDHFERQLMELLNLLRHVLSAYDEEKRQRNGWPRFETAARKLIEVLEEKLWRSVPSSGSSARSKRKRS